MSTTSPDAMTETAPTVTPARRKALADVAKHYNRAAKRGKTLTGSEVATKLGKSAPSWGRTAIAEAKELGLLEEVAAPGAAAVHLASVPALMPAPSDAPERRVSDAATVSDGTPEASGDAPVPDAPERQIPDPRSVRPSVTSETPTGPASGRPDRLVPDADTAPERDAATTAKPEVNKRVSVSSDASQSVGNDAVIAPVSETPTRQIPDAPQRHVSDAPKAADPGVPDSVKDKIKYAAAGLAGVVIATAFAASATTLAGLGKAVGWSAWDGRLAWLLPVSLDVLAVMALLAWLLPSTKQLGKWLTIGAVATSVVLNAFGHAIEVGEADVSLALVIAVSTVPVVAMAFAVHAFVELLRA